LSSPSNGYSLEFNIFSYALAFHFKSKLYIQKGYELVYNSNKLYMHVFVAMPFGDKTYLEGLSKDLNKYPTVRDTLNGLDRNILIKKPDIDKLAVDKSNLEAFLFLLVVTIYVYSIVLNAAKIQTQKNLKVLLNIFYYLLNFEMKI